MPTSRFLFGALSLTLALTFLLPTLALAQASTDESVQSGNVLGRLFFQLFWVWFLLRSRKQPIGGWLLYYYIGLYIWTPIDLILSLGAYQDSLPSAWPGESIHYGLYLITIWPTEILSVGELWIAHRLRKTLSWRYVPILRKLMAIKVAVGCAALAIDGAVWPDFVFYDIISLVPVVIWLAYFHRSQRVWSVFHEGVWPPGMYSVSKPRSP